MKILTIITRGDSIGGAQTHVLSICRQLLKNGHDVHVLVGGYPGVFTELLNENEIPFSLVGTLKREISILNDLKSYFALKKAIKEINPDVIALHSTKAGILGRLVRLTSRIPTVFTVHGWSFTEGIPKSKFILYKFIEKLLGNIADRVIVVSEFDRRLALKYKVVNEKKLVTVHNGISVTDNANRQATNESPVNLIMTARFDHQKDHSTLLRACKDLTDIKIHLLGDGPEEQNIKQLANNLGIADKVNFVGYTKNVNHYLSQSDIFVLISNWEGFPISTLEAMRYRLPVVISDVGGAAEAVRSGENGYTVDRGDVTGLSEKLKDLIENKSLRIRMGEASFKLLSQNFTEEIMYNKTVEVYKQICI